MTQPYTGWNKPITDNTTVYAKFTKQEVAKYSFEIKANIENVEFDKLEVIVALQSRSQLILQLQRGINSLAISKMKR